jgi:hypothetical protein
MSCEWNAHHTADRTLCRSATLQLVVLGALALLRLLRHGYVSIPSYVTRALQRLFFEVVLVCELLTSTVSTLCTLWTIVGSSARAMHIAWLGYNRQ